MIVLSNAEHSEEYKEALDACLKENTSSGKKSHNEIKNEK